MRDPTAGGAEHISLWYRNPSERIGHLVREVGAGIAAGEAVLARVPDALWSRAVPALGDAAGRVEWLPVDDQYGNPVEAMAALAGFVERSQADHAPRIRAVGELPLVHGSVDERWVRYEGAVSHLFAEVPLRAACLVDASTATAGSLETMAAVHHAVDDGSGLRPSDLFDPVGTCRRLVTRPPSSPADAVLRHPSAAAGRLAATDLAADLLTADRLADLRLVVTELVTNALRHNGDGVELRLWRSPGGVTLAVSDHGPGIGDPFAGLRPPGFLGGGRGLWLVGHLCDELGWSHEDGTNTVVARVRA
jgi:anti-sigma regulatory factor (Ser/Thr protein kinase)